jgi:ATP-dependent helicase/nuclease subunit A
VSLTDAQRLAVSSGAGAVITAGAGCGKTFVLTERYVHHLAVDGFSPLEVVATTFTRKAAAELRERIRRRAAELLPGRPDVLAELEAAQISTIDGLAARVCRDHPEEAGVPADFRVMDESESSLWLLEHLDRAMAKAPEWCFGVVPFAKLRGWTQALLTDPLAAEAALALTPADWEGLCLRTRNEARERLLERVAAPRALLKGSRGAAEDRKEELRRLFLAALEEVEADHEVEAALERITSANLAGGSPRNWPPGELGPVNGALSGIKTAVKGALRQGAVALRLGEADERLAVMLPAVRETFAAARGELVRLKFAARALAFEDLEVGAARALEHAHVREHYRERWRALLVDELQDTNPVQERLLAALAEGATMTVVGDVKQSIYAFRRADLTVFHRFRRRIVAAGGAEVLLDRSFRTHAPLLARVNDLSAFLGELQQPLTAHRVDVPSPGPHVEALVLQRPPRYRDERLVAEGLLVARRIRELLDAQVLVHGEDGLPRPVRPGDIAVLTRYKKPLRPFSEALTAYGIPNLLSESKGLLATREAQDGVALLRFLAHPEDDLAVAALLRSPFFAVDDACLQEFAEDLAPNTSWLEGLQGTGMAPLAHARDVLSALAKQRGRHLPTELFELADRLTGYSAVIANLPGGRRREADWRAFLDLVRRTEADSHDAFAVWRTVRRLLRAGVELPRPALEAGDVVTLMNLHKAKGLEWPVVILADLSVTFLRSRDQLFFDADVGFGVTTAEGTGKPLVFTALQAAKHQGEAEEEKRLLYVGLTRARDGLILTASETPKPERSSAFNLLDGLEWREVEVIPEEPSASPIYRDRFGVEGRFKLLLTESELT